MLTWLKQLFCPHKTGELTKRDGSRVYVECMDCGRQSPGVQMPLRSKRRAVKSPVLAMPYGKARLRAL